MKFVPALLIEDETWFDAPGNALPRTPVALSDDGWADDAETTPAPRLTDQREVSMYPGDLVLYRCGGNLVPAALIEPAAGGHWLARDSRHGRGVFRLSPEDIATRLRRRGGLEEAA